MFVAPNTMLQLAQSVTMSKLTLYLKLQNNPYNNLAYIIAYFPNIELAALRITDMTLDVMYLS